MLGRVRAGANVPRDVRLSSFFPQIVRAGGAAALDYRFERRSPLPALDVRAIERGDAGELVLPPPAWRAPGNQSFPGLAFLVALGRFLDAKRVFEIGTYNGATAWCLARNLRAEVHTLDLPPDQGPALAYGVSDEGNHLEFAHHAYDMLPLEEGSVVQHWGDSARFDFAPWKGSIDLVYVDGAHSAEYVRADSASAFGLLRDSGAIVWDDYWRRIPGVSEVLHELDEPIYRVPDTRLTVYLSPSARARMA